jgi:hypothetical protein
MTPESQNQLLARRFLEEVVNTGAVDRLSELLEVLLEQGLVRWASEVGTASPPAPTGSTPKGGPGTCGSSAELTQGSPSVNGQLDGQKRGTFDVPQWKR